METCMAGEHTAESALPVLDVKNECMGACGPPRALSKTDRWCVAGIRSDRLKEEKAAAGGKKTVGFFEDLGCRDGWRVGGQGGARQGRGRLAGG